MPPFPKGFEAKNKVAIIGAAHSQLGRRLERPTGALAVDACLAAIADAGLDVKDIDGVSNWPATDGQGVGPREGYNSAHVEWMVQGLGIEQVNWWQSGGGGNIASAVTTAMLAINSGICENVLVWRAMWQPRSGRGSGTRSAAELEAARTRPAPRVSDEAAYTAPYGIGGPGGFASSYMRYMKMYGAKRHHMAAYALAARHGGNNNPYSVFKDQILTYEDYMNARMIADPLCLFDCDMPVDGAGAIVLTRADLAKDMKQKPAYVTAMGSGGWNWENIPPEAYRYDSAANNGRTLWSSTYMKPTDMSGAMFYDGFTPDIYWWLEGFRFCKFGEAYEWIQNGRIAAGGELPINTFGGQVSEGRLHGIGHWIEGVKQVQGRADNQPGDGARQIKNVENILVATGMTGHGTGAILSPEPR